MDNKARLHVGLDNSEHVVLYKGGDVRISNSAEEAEQLRRQGWSDTLPEGVELNEDALAKAEAVFAESFQTELEGENVTPENPSGAATPPDAPAQASGQRTVMGTHDMGLRPLGTPPQRTPQPKPVEPKPKPS